MSPDSSQQPHYASLSRARHDRRRGDVTLLNRCSMILCASPLSRSTSGVARSAKSSQAAAMMSTPVLSAKLMPVSLKPREEAAKRLYCFPNSRSAPSQVGFARNSDHTSGRGALLHLHLKLLRLFLHPNPSKLADKTESFRRRRSIVPFNGDFSTLSIGVHISSLD